MRWNHLCLQGHNNPGSRMSTYVDVSSNQHAANSTRPSTRKVNYILTLKGEKKQRAVFSHCNAKRDILNNLNIGKSTLTSWMSFI